MTGTSIAVGSVDKIGKIAVLTLLGDPAEQVYDFLMEHGWTVAWQDGFVKFGPKGFKQLVIPANITEQPDAWGIQSPTRFMYSHYGEPLKLFHGEGPLMINTIGQAGPVAEA